MLPFVKRLTRRLALPEALGWLTFWISALVYLGTTLFFDARRFGGPFYLWVAAWALGQILLLGWVAAFVRLMNLGQPRAWLRVACTIVIGITAGIARGFFMGVFSTVAGIANEPQWSFRLGGGAAAGLVITVAGAALVGAALEHHSVITKLTAAQNLLLEARRNAPKSLDQGRAEITDMARRTIGPRIAQIEAALAKAKLNDDEFNAIANDIRAVIHSEVRPTASYLALRVEEALNEQPALPKAPKNYLGLPTRFKLSAAISPGISFGIALMLSVSTFAPLADPKTTALSVLGAIFIFVVLALLQKLLAALPSLPSSVATLLLGLFGALSTIPLSTLTQLSLRQNQHLSALPAQSAFIMAVLVVGIGFTRLVDADRLAFEQELEASNRELAKEKSWIDAQYWVIRREWAYLLHGKVQSSLTAAIARIQAAKTLDDSTATLVKRDVARARAALRKGVNNKFDLLAALNETVASWQGVCEIHLDISEATEQATKSDQGIGRAINEIVREAVSNAVRHGNAENVWVRAVENHGVLELESLNDGKPVTKRSRASLGTEMLGELTLEWSLRNTPKGVLLEAKLAVATSSSSF